MPLFRFTLCLIFVTCFLSLQSQEYRLLIPKQSVVDLVQDDIGILYYIDSDGTLYRHNSKLETVIPDLPPFTQLELHQGVIYAVAESEIWRLKDEVWSVFVSWDKDPILEFFSGGRKSPFLAVTKNSYYQIDKSGLTNRCSNSRNLNVITADETVKAVYAQGKWHMLDKGKVRQICGNSKTIISKKYVVDLVIQDDEVILITENDGPYRISDNLAIPQTMPSYYQYPGGRYGQYYKDYYLSFTPFDVKRYSTVIDEVITVELSQAFYPEFVDRKGRVFGYDEIGIGYIATVPHNESTTFDLIRMEIDGTSVIGQSSYELKQSTAQLKVEAESINWSDKNQTLYYYKLPPKIKEWQEWNITSPLLLTLDDETKQLELKSEDDGKVTKLLEGPFPIRTIEKQNDSPWYILLGSLILLVIGSLIANSRLNNLKKQHEQRLSRITLQKQYAEEQLKSLQLQMNPHFLFNVLNSIQGLIALGEHKLARQNLNRFAQLMRGTLYQSTVDSVTLESEVKIIDQYLRLEQLCRPDKFEYTITVSNEIDVETKIPSMIIQPFVENAILHGIRWKEDFGHIEVSLAQVQNGILCIIKDDGVGRKIAESKKEQKHKSIGLDIVQNRLKKYFRFKPNLKTIVYHDNVDSHRNGSGTEVEVLLPIL